MKISRKRYDAVVKRFAKKAAANYAKVESIEKKYGLSEKCMDEIRSAIDSYVNLNYDIRMFAVAHGIDESDFFCDVTNMEVE